MYTISLQLLVKGDFSKFLEELLFGTYLALLGFSTELQNAEVFVTLLKGDSTTDALPAILKILRTSKGNTCGGLSFPYSHRWIGQFELFKRIATKDVFLIILQNFHSSSFFQHVGSEQLNDCLVTENLKFTESAVGKTSGNTACNRKLLKI